MNLDEAQAKLEALGVKHAPMQKFTDPPHNEYAREITLSDPKGVYYLLDSDNDGAAMKAGFRCIQLMFLNTPEHAVHYAAQIGWNIDSVEVLPVVGVEHPGVPSAIMSIRA